MLKQSNSPDGYKHLLVYKKAEELLAETTKFTSEFPRIISRLIEQMDSSARSTKANIVEGWKRNATYEYYTFLGYSIASNAELFEDYLDICLGRYEAKGIKGVNGTNGETEEKGSKGEMGEKGEMGVRGTKGVEETRQWLETLRFYPLDTTLPLSVQLYLRAKELNMLLEKLQQSLLERMQEKKTLSEPDRMRLVREEKKKKGDEAEAWTKGEWERLGIVQTPRGVKKKEEAERLGLAWWNYGEPEK
ncbi:MAG: four helix bundle protein [bacterium]|nr:four helix bundle protein [bacterium]